MSSSVNRTRRLAVTAMLLALGTVLSMVKVLQMPFGGSITLLSMLPVCMISIEYGVKWGLISSFIFSLIQFGFGVQEGCLGWGFTGGLLIVMILFDYIVAFSVLGVAGLFRKKGLGGIVLGVALAVFLRFVCHFITGFALWTYLDFSISFGSFTLKGPYWYSLLYNGAYMLPECITTVIGASILFKIPVINKLMAGDKI